MHFSKANNGFSHVLFDNELVPDEEAKIHVMTPCIQYAASVFEVVRGYWNEDDQQLYLFRLEEHAQRMVNSAKLLRMERRFDADAISSAVVELLQYLNCKQDVSVRQTLFVDGRGPVESTGPVKMAAVAIPGIRGFGPKWVDGLNVCVTSWTRIQDRSMPPRIKAAANYQNSRLAQTEAIVNGYDTALILNATGKVAEGTSACLMMVRDGVIATPPVTAGILEGITRRTIIALIHEIFGKQVIEREIDRTELYLAEELFLCGTGAEIAPILSVDKHGIGTGKIGKLTEGIREAYMAVARRTERVGDKHDQWWTPVHSE